MSWVEIVASLAHLGFRWILSTGLVVVGLVYGLAAFGFTNAVPSRHVMYLVLAVLSIKCGQTIASKRRLPF